MSADRIQAMLDAYQEYQDKRQSIMDRRVTPWPCHKAIVVTTPTGADESFVRKAMEP